MYDPIHLFLGGNDDGCYPAAGVVFGPDGALYGTTTAGGSNDCYTSGCGTVFKLQPPAGACKSAICPWTETILYRFTGEPSGWSGPTSNVAFDQAGNIYGTVNKGGAFGVGMVYELTASTGWTEHVVYNFQLSPDGYYPFDGLILDGLGNLYGTTQSGGSNEAGTVYELTPTGAGWVETILHSFGASYADFLGSPVAGLVFDQSGNLYGSTQETTNGSCCGGIFNLVRSADGWTYNIVTSFSCQGDSCYAVTGLNSRVTIDATGNFYGTSLYGPHDSSVPGGVFELSGDYGEIDLHLFNWTGDGALPMGGVALGGNGKLYGTTFTGGTGVACSTGCGIVYEITPVLETLRPPTTSWRPQ